MSSSVARDQAQARRAVGEHGLDSGEPSAPADARPQGAGVLTWARGILLSMRPHQWLKNLFVFAPLVFAQRLVDASGHLDWATVGRSVAAFAIFCLASGGVYLLNDLADRERDRRHPVKCHRPIASGALPVRVAAVAIAVVASTALGWAWWLGADLALVVCVYVLVNIAYSFALKKIPFVDIALIAAGFWLRVLAGAEAIDVPVTWWLYAATFLLAAYLALGKRRHELHAGGDDAHRRREVLAAYRPAHLDGAFYAAGTATAACYVAYTLSEHAALQFGTRWLAVTIPFMLFGLGRFAVLTARHDTHDSPTDAMIRDLPFVLNLALWAATVVAIIYVG